MQSLSLDRTPAPPHGGAPGAPEQLDTVIAGLQARMARMAAYYARCSRIDHEDLLQDAWLCVLEAHREFDAEAGSLQPWLINRARWRMLDVIKHQRFRQCASFNEMEEDHAVEDFSTGDGVESEEFITTLSPIQQRILRCLMNGWTWRDTGEQLGCTSANVAYHIREIRNRYGRFLVSGS